MKWHEYYDYIRIQDEKIGDIDEFLWTIGLGQIIHTDLVIKNPDPPDHEENPPPITPEEDLKIIIIEIKICDELDEAGLLITFKTRGLLPEGVRHGTFTTKFKDSGSAYLPPEMFEEDEVPASALAYAKARAASPED